MNDHSSFGYGPYNHETLTALAKELGRPLGSLFGQSRPTDPFIADIPSRRTQAEWFAGIWRDLDIRPGAHLRRIHYRVVSQAEPILMPDGQPYINSTNAGRPP